MSDLAHQPAPSADVSPGGTAIGEGSVALVVNPTKADDVAHLTATVAARCAEHGLPAPAVLPTTQDDPGEGMAREAIDGGARLVLAAGGDGTVRAVAQALCGTGVALGVLALGTGNLLARNLGLPTDLGAAIDTALAGCDRTIDVGRLDDGTIFAIMAGAGFDAAMMREAPESLKSAVGWPAYLVGGVRSLRRDRVGIRLRLDGKAPISARARTVIIGNMGQLQGGLDLLPGAEPDDGLLDVLVVCPRRISDWIVLLSRALTHRPRTDHRMQTYQARAVDVRMHRRQPRQVDGDLIATGLTLVARVDPGALIVRVPRQPES
jgi:diacylglycerol kinase (ATP)